MYLGSYHLAMEEVGEVERVQQSEGQTKRSRERETKRKWNRFRKQLGKGKKGG